MRRLASFVSVLVLGATAAACVNDAVAPDLPEPECGNGVLELGEECDAPSAGCSACAIVPGWVCADNQCSFVCGDGVVGSGTRCDSPRRDTDCDMTGYWAVRETDYERDDIVGSIQTSSTWYLFHLAQTGDAFEVVEALDCGIHVTGGTTVDFTPASLRANIGLNRMDLTGAHGPRRGVSKSIAGGCSVSLDRWYKIRGGDDALLPADFAAHLPLTALLPLPKVDDPVTSTEDPPLAISIDGNGQPGMGYRLSGFVYGTRYSVQRDWKEYATLPSAPAPAAALSFGFPGAFDLEESVLRVTDCGVVCALAASTANVAQNLAPRVTFAFVGKTFGSPRVSSVVAGAPRADLGSDLTTCANVRRVLPHDPSVPASDAGASTL